MTSGSPRPRAVRAAEGVELLDGERVVEVSSGRRWVNGANSVDGADPTLGRASPA